MGQLRAIRRAGDAQDDFNHNAVVSCCGYPHPEGTSDPIERLDATLTGCDQAAFDGFYHCNMEDAMGLAT